MPRPPKYVEGFEVGALTLLKRIGDRKWEAQCACGTHIEVHTSTLSQSTPYCGKCEYGQVVADEVDRFSFGNESKYLVDGELLNRLVQALAMGKRKVIGRELQDTARMWQRDTTFIEREKP